MSEASETLIVFLRAVNVGGRNRVPMKPLAAALGERLGVPVKTVLQSGNVVVPGRSAARDARAELRVLVDAVVTELSGVASAPVVRSGAELAALLARIPDPEAEPARLHLSMWDEAADPRRVAELVATDWGDDRLTVVGDNAWMLFCGSSQASRLGNATIERRLRISATTRNAATIRQLAGLAAPVPVVGRGAAEGGAVASARSG